MDPASSREVAHDSGGTISYFYHEFFLRSLCDFDPNSSESEYLQKIFSCNLKFGSWVYNAGQLDIINTITMMDLEGYMGSVSYDLDSTAVERHETFYECCP